MHNSVEQVPKYKIQGNRRIVVVRTLPDIEKIREDWIYLSEKFGKSTPFLNYEIFKQLNSSCEDGKKPLVVVFYDEEEPVALLVGNSATIPLFSIKTFGLSIFSMRCWNIVFDGIITNNKADSIDAVINYFYDLLKSGRMDLINLRHMCLDDKATSKIIRHLQSRFNTISKPELHFNRELIDADTGLEISNHSKKTKYNFRRSDRILVKYFGGAVEVQSFHSLEDVNAFIEDADSIVSQTYQAALGAGITNNKHWQDVVSTLASINSFRGYVLKSSDIPIAYLLGAVIKDRFTLFATGFLPKYQKLSPGTVLINRVFTSLTDEGINIVDLGFGDAAYKRLHSTQIEQDLSLKVYGKRFRNISGWIFDLCNKISIRIARFVIEKVGLSQTVKRIWRKYLLEHSIHTNNMKVGK